MAAPLRVFRVHRRSLVADRGRRLLPACDEEGTRHACADARLGTPRAAQESAGARPRTRRPDHVGSPAAVSSAGPPQGANSAPLGGSAAATAAAVGDVPRSAGPPE